MASRCKKFQPNIFNKSKCQSCFRSKEAHSAEALESSKASRKISKCGYLFVAPESFDFTSPLDRTRRWQRRFFILYDDGALTWSVDENVGTIPQGEIDMNKCTDVHDGENLTGHQFSLVVSTPDQKAFIKGTCKEESTRWYDVLVMYPRSTKTKTRRSPPYIIASKTKESSKPSSTTNDSSSSSSWHPPGATSLKKGSHHIVLRPRGQSVPATARDSSSEHKPDSVNSMDLTVNGSALGREGGGKSELNDSVRSESNVMTYRSVRSMKHKNDRSYQDSLRRSNSLQDLTASGGAGSKHEPSMDDDDEGLYRTHSRESLYDSFPKRRAEKKETRSMSAPVTAQKLPNGEVNSAMSSRTQSPGRSMERDVLSYSAGGATTSYLVNHRNKNETDEHKMAKSSGVRIGQLHTDLPSRSTRSDKLDDLMYMKKGWLLRQDSVSQEWTKHWFVLSGTSLKYFQDAKAEEAGQMDGVIDLSVGHNISEVHVSRNYGFKLQTQFGDHSLSAMTSGIRNNWMQAIQKCIDMSAHGEDADLGAVGGKESQTTNSRTSRKDSGVSNHSRFTKNTSSVPWPRSHSPGTAAALAARWEAASKNSSGSRTPSGSRSGSRERLGQVNGTISFPQRERSPSPIKGRKLSCTWPYDSPPISDTSSTESRREHSRSSSVVSDVSAYLDDEEGHTNPRELSAEEQKELDNVEKNIRRIHRKSISEYVQQHKPQHFDKFESGSAFKSDHEEVPGRSRETSHERETMRSNETLRDGEAVSSVSQRTPSSRVDSPGPAFNERGVTSGTHLAASTPKKLDNVDREKSPMTSRAPSAKVKDKSRSKSPRPKSPPPQRVELDHLSHSSMRTTVDHTYARRTDLTSRWKEEESNTSTREGSQSPSAGTADAALVELLETEVESLKSRLKKTESELEAVNNDNVELRNQIRSSHRDHRRSLDDMESDQSRYMMQIEDMQTQMEKTTNQLKRKLEETQQQSEQARQQVEELKKQASEFEVKVKAQRKENSALREKLNCSTTDYSSAQSSLQQTCISLSAERDQLQQMTSDLELRIRELEREVNRLLAVISDKNREISMKDDTVLQLQKQIDLHSQQPNAMKSKSGDVTQLEKELAEKSSRMAALNQEFVLTKRLLKEKEKELREAEEESEAQLTEAEAEFNKEKEALQGKITLLERRVEQVLKQSNMSDSLNTSMADILREKDETIAQLEEKLIENDKKIEDLSEELAMEIEENTTMQQNLDTSYEDKARLKRDLDLAKKEVSKLNSGLDKHKVEVGQLKQLMEQRDMELAQLRKDCSHMEADLHELERENNKLKTISEKYQEQADQVTREAGEMMDNHQALQEQLDGLQAQNADLTLECEKLTNELEAASTQVKDNEDRLTRQKAQFDSDLQQQYRQISASKELVLELQKKLSEAEMKMKKGTVPQSHTKSSMAGLEKENSELQEKYDKLFSEVKRLRRELKEAYGKADEMELVNVGHQQQLRTMESDYQGQLKLMTNRIQDLTNKLNTSERRVRKLERKTLRRRRTREEKNITIKEGEVKEGERQDSTEKDEDQEEEEVTMDVPDKQDEEELYDSDGGSLPDHEMAIHQLQSDLVKSEEKVKSLQGKILEQHSAKIDLYSAQQEQQALRDQNKLYQEQLDYLRSKMSGSQSNKDSPAQTNQLLLTLKDFKKKLSNVIQELGTFGVIPTKDVYTSTVESIRERLKSILKECESQQGDMPAGLVNVSSFMPEDMLGSRTAGLDQSLCVKMYAEKLALEAVVVGEMAYLVKTNQDCIMSEQELYLHLIQEANNAVLELERKVQLLQADGNASLQTHKGHDSLFAYSSLLADKMVLQEQMLVLIETYQKEQQQTSATVEGTVNTGAKKLAQEALFRGKMDQQLVKPGGESAEKYAPSLASRAMVQGELAFVLSKLKERMSESKSDQERIDILEQELAVAQHQLQERSCNMVKAVDTFQDAQLSRLASLLTMTPSAASDAASARHDLDRGLVHAELTLSINKFAEQHEKRFSFVKGASEVEVSRRHFLIDAAVQQQIQSSLQLFDSQCATRQKKQQVETQQSTAELESVKLELMLQLSDVVAQKAVINGQSQFIEEQLGRQGQSDRAERTPTRLQRHDSGIMVHGSSVPSSPMEGANSTGAGSTLTVLVENLSRDSVMRQELAAYLQGSVEEGHEASEVSKQIACVAASLAQVDVSLGLRRRAIQDYAEVISREAIFQAQMVYIINQVRAEHQAQLAKLRAQVQEAQGRAGEGENAEQQKYVDELEVEVERLGALVTQNDAHLQAESTHAQKQLQQLTMQLEKREAQFQHQITQLEANYKAQVGKLREELAGGVVTDDVQSALQRADTIEAEKNDLTQKYEAHVEKLEAEIHNVHIAHQKELEQAKTDMKTAMKALHDARSQGTEKLEDEVRRLKEKLDEERGRYVKELEKLRQELHSDSEQTAQALLSSKIQQLEVAMQNMQADYEQELATQKTAHRRELARSKDEMLQMLADAEAKSIHIDEGVIRKKYVKDIDRIKEIYDRGFAAMEKSHQRVLMDMRRAHKLDLDKLRIEKDQLLAEETKATQAALDAMKKAHEAELQKERNKFLDAIAKTYSNNDVESLQRQHEEDLELIQAEIKQLSEQYSIKCLENASLEERLESQTKSLQQSRRRNHDLMARNEELNLRIQQEIEKLNKFISTKSCPMSPLKKDKEPPEVYDLKVSLRVKDVEVQQLRDEISSLKEQLQGTTEELEESMERLQELHLQQQSSRESHQMELVDMRSRLADAMSQMTRDVTETEDLETGSLLADSSEGISTPADVRPKVSHTKSSPETGRSLPRVPNETRAAKKMLWRQRYPERAHTSPSPVTPGVTPYTGGTHDGTAPGISPKMRRRGGSVNSPESRRRADRHNTTMGFDVANQDNKF